MMSAWTLRPPAGWCRQWFDVIFEAGILAVPTGIVTAAMTSRRLGGGAGRGCPACGSTSHLADARFCQRCGAPLSA